VFGWRGTLWGMTGLTLVVAAGIALLVRDPAKVEHGSKGSLFDLLKMPALWPVLAMMVVCYAPAAGLRGLWVGPYFADVFAADAAELGRATLVMGLAMVAGNFAYGPLERFFGTRKWLVFGGNLAVAGCLCALWLLPDPGVWGAMLLLAGVGFFGSSFGMVIAHGRAFFPPHLIGRGVTLLNLFGIAAVGLAQVATGRLHAAVGPSPTAAPYQAIFGFFAVALAIGLVIYAFSRDRTD
jgi:predicted MFS family arabinose efflux permease